jgi:predicted nucleic acid-binding protein
VANSLLVDSSFLYELFNQSAPYHAAAQLVASKLHQPLMIPEVILTEVAFLFRRAGGVPAVVRFLDALLISQPQIESITYEDLARARQIMQMYADSKLDFVDCCLMALAERLKITQVCTFDQRDFAIFRPAHCDYLELLP